MAIKPTSQTDWGVGNPDFSNRVVEPSTAKKQAAWLDSERPPAPIMNWLFYNQDAWIKYLEEVTDSFKSEFDIKIGAGLDYADLNAAVADGALGSNITVLVVDSATISTVQTLSKSGWRILFKPGVTYTKDTVTECFSIEAANIEILNGRFVGWSGGSDSVFKYTSGGEYGKIIGARFGAGTNQEVDDSAVNVQKVPLIEQTINEV